MNAGRDFLHDLLSTRTQVPFVNDVDDFTRESIGIDLGFSVTSDSAGCVRCHA